MTYSASFPLDRFVHDFDAGRPPAAGETARWFAFRGSDLLVVAPRVVIAPRVVVAPAAGPETARTPHAVPHAPDLSGLGLLPVRVQRLGTLDGVPCFAAELPAAEGPGPGGAPDGHEFLSLRRLFDLLDPAELAVAGLAFQIQFWDRAHRFCAACATPLTLAIGERKKHCPSCKTEYYPRIAPCAIVLVSDDSTGTPRVLMTRQPRYPAGMYGLVAGFLEAGESLEACAVREVHEETGLHITDVRYFGSQPWPFPHQIMVGFTARLRPGPEGGTLRVDTSELEDARFFDIDRLPALPPRMSIARALVEAWRDEQRAKRPAQPGLPAAGAP